MLAAVKAKNLQAYRKDTFKDKLSGAKCDRPGLAACLLSLKSGDTLVVCAGFVGLGGESLARTALQNAQCVS